jgi:hypothetical protein
MISELLFIIPSPFEWSTNQVANIIGVVSAVATVAALWYAFYRDRKQDKKISDLAVIAVRLSEQNELLSEQNQITRTQLRDEAKPYFIFEGTSSYTEGLEIDFFNKGKTARIGRIQIIRDKMTYSTGGEIIPKNDTFRIFIKSATEKDINDCDYYLLVEYFDIYNNPYGMSFTFHGGIITSRQFFETSPKFRDQP